MSASVGDRFVIHGRTVGNPQRHGVVIEIGGVDGGPPFVVRWGDGAMGRGGERARGRSSPATPPVELHVTRQPVRI
ncbi:DUF1918 domain-containing protein [Candidatus Frankia alpina]|uniref:DUF1918 domain-containing protein n=2 Tax=Candidatus Frankia alpina TaxID=2699483 RepID=A0A4S5EPJ5_9ACTN|nr:DUF1918 domain-containing protein [Candidatus Frankia alpina]